MFSSANCPVSSEEADWIHDSCLWLVQSFGIDAIMRPMLQVDENQFPPGVFKPVTSVTQLLAFICARLDVPVQLIDLVEYDDRATNPLDLGLVGAMNTNGAAGLVQLSSRGRFPIGLAYTITQDPLRLVATLAHEVAHIRLFQKDASLADESDFEPLTDLTAAVAGFGLFCSNAAVRAEGISEGVRQGWSVSRLGYLTQIQFGYALAVRAFMTQEDSTWSHGLPENSKVSFEKGLKFLTHHPPEIFLAAGPLKVAR